MKIKLLATSLAFIFNASAATLESPEHIQVLSINGESQGFNFFSKNRKFELPKGVISLKVKYKDLIDEHLGDGHATIKSDEVTLHFEVQNINDTYQLKSERPSSIEKAQKYAKKPNIEIFMQNKKVELLKPQYQPVDPETEDKAAKMLNYWWEQADEQTKRDFLKKIATNNIVL